METIRTPFLTDLVDFIDENNPHTIEVHGKTYTQVVHCKDCKWWDGLESFCNNLELVGIEFDDFCSLGEEREQK